MIQQSLLWLESRMESALRGRAEKKSLRDYDAMMAQLNDGKNAVCLLDFSSNDYLGLARDAEQQRFVEERYQSLIECQGGEANDNYNNNITSLGATGSRLLSGDSTYARRLEQKLARYHHRAAALLCNSGYDANLAILSCLPVERFVYDEYAHNSLRMGMRLSKNNKNPCNTSFQHNNVDDLRRILLEATRSANSKSNDCTVSSSSSSSSSSSLHLNNNTLIVVESLYSMDGDVAPLKDILETAREFGALVIVDEAHGLGVYGTGQRGTGLLTQLGLENHQALACSVHTFGKAAGCHGAVVCGSTVLRQYLWNYGWPIVYSTALPLHSLVAIDCAYETMTSRRGYEKRQFVTQTLVPLFRQLLKQQLLLSSPAKEVQQKHHHQQQQVYLLPSESPIQALVLPHNGNEACTTFCQLVWKHSNHSIRLYPIKSPTVPVGQERIRIILHTHNTSEEVETLVKCIKASLIKMGILSHREHQLSKL